MTPSNEVKVIERSLQCLVCGWWSLVPLLGIPMLVLAFRHYQFVRITAGPDWNPGEKQLKAGIILAGIGAFISAVLFVALLYHLV